MPVKYAMQAFALSLSLSLFLPMCRYQISLHIFHHQKRQLCELLHFLLRNVHSNRTDSHSSAWHFLAGILVSCFWCIYFPRLLLFSFLWSSGWLNGLMMLATNKMTGIVMLMVAILFTCLGLMEAMLLIKVGVLHLASWIVDWSLIKLPIKS